MKLIMRLVFITILLSVGLFAQSLDDLRIRREKQFDYAALIKNATHTAIRGEIYGVVLSETQIQEYLDKADEYEGLLLQLLTGQIESESEPVVIDSSKIWIKELVFNATKYFWKSPRVDSINKLKLAFDKDYSGIDYLIINYRTRIYSAQHEYVLKQLNKIRG